VCINHVAYFLNGKLNPPPNCIDGDLGDGDDLDDGDDLGDGDDGDGDDGDGDDGDGDIDLNAFAFLNMAIYASTTSSILSCHLLMSDTCVNIK